MGVRHVLSILDIRDYLPELVEKSLELKKSWRRIKEKPLADRILCMIFEKPSTRTRASFEAAMLRLGGHAVSYNWSDLQLGRGEPIKDTARVLSRYFDAIMLRTRKHETQEEFARYSSVPVINGLSDLEHPCQALADMMTIFEKKGHPRDLKIGYIGDGNNVCNSLILASVSFGATIEVACPPGYEPPARILEEAERIARETGAELDVVRDPVEAARDADVIYTDVWVSMGQEDELEKRLRDFAGYQVNRDLLKHAKEDAIVMHCLPAQRGREITEDVLEGPNSVVFDQAENRMYAQAALLIFLLLDRD